MLPTIAPQLPVPDDAYLLNRRASVRRLCNRRAVAGVAMEPELTPRKGQNGTVQDLSIDGVGLLLPVELPVESILLIEPCQGSWAVPLLVARVVRTAAWGGG